MEVIGSVFNPDVWSAVPFSFWSVVFFALGTIVGSLLNVCIHRMPRGESIVSPPSHCPHCGGSIPWYFNIPIATWIYLRGRCAKCAAPISVRYLVVELLTGIAFLGCWLAYGAEHPWLALAYCLFVSGLIVATFIDFEHFIIPDELTLGGMVAGVFISAAVPALHMNLFTNDVPDRATALTSSLWGMAVGAGIVYAILRLGKLLFGRQRFQLEPGTEVRFTETSLELPGQQIPYEDIFYRKSDAIIMDAERVELNDRCYFQTSVRLTPSLLRIGEDEFNPEQITLMTVLTREIVVPREAMGLGDVKFMGAIGAFLGWPAVIFSLMVSAFVGAFVGVTLIVLRRHEWSSRLPYGPYIALAALFWIFGGRELTAWWFTHGQELESLAAALSFLS